MRSLRKVEATLLCTALMLGASTARASLVSYDFGGAIDFGTLAGQAYGGSLTYDAAVLSGVAAESLSLRSLNFRFLGQDLGPADGAADPTAEFQDGVFLGLSYTVAGFDPAFSFIAGSSDASDAYFAYTPSSGVAGFGSVTYTPTAVPVPAAAWLLVSGAPMLAAVGRRRFKA